MILNLNEFCKLYKINVPHALEQKYYFDLLQKSNQYSNLQDLILNFEDWEKEISSDISNIKYKCLEQIKEKLQSLNCYQELNNFKPPHSFWTQFDFRSKYMDQHWISLDIKSANYTALKYFDSTNELPELWDDFLFDLRIPYSLHQSKSFRQMVFGNLNPKQTQKLIFSLFTSPLKSELNSYI